MAMSPSSLLAKLDELKKWQEVQQERLLKQHKQQLEETDRKIQSASDYETIQGLSAFNSVLSTHDESHNTMQHRTSFEQLEQNENAGLPKRPYLKRGSGLQKFGMKPGDQKRPFNKLKVPKTAVHKRLAELRKEERKQTVEETSKRDDETKQTQACKKSVRMVIEETSKKEGETKQPQAVKKNVRIQDSPPKARNSPPPPKAVVTISRYTLGNYSDPPVEITPLRVPDMTIQPKAKWFPASESSLDESDVPVIVSNKNPTNATPLNREIIESLASKKFGTVNDCTDKLIDEINKMSPSLLDESDVNKQLIEYLKQLAKRLNDSKAESQSVTSDGELTAYEKALEKELQVFEQLEQKVLQSSFCSTNSSVLDLLSSTPNKIFRGRQEDQENKNVGVKGKGEVKAKRELEFVDQQCTSDESSVNSADLEEDKTMADDENWSNLDSKEEEDYSETTSTSSVQSYRIAKVIVKQNAATMTESVLEAAESKTSIHEDALARKMRDLDMEIKKYRAENSKLQKLKEQVENEQHKLQRERKQMLKELQEERIKFEFESEEERKKLAREKMVFERYAKDVQKGPSKKEREELSNLRAEVANLKETIKLKDTRNGTTQARLRNQVKTLEKENANLKDEMEKLQKQNAKFVAAQNITRKQTESKMLQEINKNLKKLTKGEPKKTNNIIDESAGKKPRNSKENKREFRKSRLRSESSNDTHSDEDHIDLVKSYTERMRCYSTKSDEGTSEEIVTLRREARSEKPHSENLDRIRTSASPVQQKLCEKENDRNLTNFDCTAFKNLSNLSIETDYDKVFGKDGEKKRNNSMNDTQGSGSGKVETISEDGSKETKYPNGNIKITSADGNFIKMTYYNGDIKETRLLEGTIKYYYAETQIWQTTFANGDEFIEFPDGQTEKRSSDGTSEVVFANGIVKVLDKNGKEKITYPDGSVVTICDGEKVLLLPNGQKEIHTKEHKRREYPDGTVKILYPDGLQETRYSNGRIRMKDKDGNLLMDTHGDI